VTRINPWLATAPFLLGSIAPIEAVCEIYMSDQQAAATLFPAKKMLKKNLVLSEEDVEAVEKASGETVRLKELTYFKSPAGELVFIDQALGKHEFITYAIGVDKSGKVKGIEILEYKESYGHEVRRPAWREQFVGKDLKSPLKVDEDIKSISGATLSSVHITHGVKRVLHTQTILGKRL